MIHFRMSGVNSAHAEGHCRDDRSCAGFSPILHHATRARWRSREANPCMLRRNKWRHRSGEVGGSPRISVREGRFSTAERASDRS